MISAEPTPIRHLFEILTNTKARLRKNHCLAFSIMKIYFCTVDKPADINKILPSIKSEKVEDQVKEALKLMLK